MNKNIYPCALAALLSLTCTASLAAAPVSKTLPSQNTSDLQSEQELRRFETETLGAEHAAEHAQARAEAAKPVTRSFVASSLAQMKDYLRELAGDRKALPAGLQSFLDEAIGPVEAAAGTPDQVGQWGAPISIPVIGIHTVLLPSGKVLFFSYRAPRNINGGVGYLWNPADGTGRILNPPDNLWCGGQTLLADGRLLVAGGNLSYGPPSASGLNRLYTFNPFNETWTRQPDMRGGRWYPTVTMLADGSAIITSGLSANADAVVNQDTERFTPSADLDGIGTVQLVGGRFTYGLYPHQFLMPSGNVLMAGPDFRDTAMFNSSTLSWSDMPDLKVQRYGYGSGVLLPGGPDGSNKVMLIGGSNNGAGALATTEMFDVDNPGAGWQFRASLPQGRRNNNTVILPDGTLLTVGGNTSTLNYENPQFEAELYNPTTNTWSAMASQTQSRAYHSTAILLPDGRVLSAGDDGAPANSPRYTNDAIEIFSPTYLFRGARPTISSAPSQITWGENFTISTPDDVTQAVLIAPAATTHGNDMNQRYVPLVINAVSGGLAAIAPPNANVAPPGYYLLFLLNSEGVPSIAEWVRIVIADDPGTPSTLQFSTADFSVNEATASALIIVTRSGSTADTASVSYATGNGTAQAGTDYTASTGTLNFAAGQTQQSFSVPITNDTAAEPNETVNVSLSNPTGATLGTPASAVLTIVDNDSGPPTTATVNFNSANFYGGEETVATITVYRASSIVGAFSVDYATSNGTAAAGADYTAVSGTLSWANGESGSKTFTVPILSDGFAEPAETFNLALSNATNGATLGAVSTAVFNIFASAGTPPPASTLHFSATNYSTGEEAGSAVITVTRAGSTTAAATVSYATSNGSATAGSDYTATSGTLNFAVGDISETFSVPLLEDTAVEGDETVNLSLSNPVGATLGTGTAILTITDNDAPPTVPTLHYSAATYSVNEATASVVISVQRDGSTADAVSVSYATSNGSATADSDYTATSGTLNFAVGDISETFSVPILEDTAVEGDETVNLTLSAPTGATLAAPTTAVLTIVDNDSAGGPPTTATVSFNSSGFNGVEGSAPVISVFRATSSAGAFSVDYATSNGTATAGNDYTISGGTLSWASGEVGSKTFTVPLLSDGISERRETINLTLSNPTNGASLGTKGTAVLGINGN